MHRSASIKAALSGAAFLFLLAGCGGGAALRQQAMTRAEASGFRIQDIQARRLPLLVLVRKTVDAPSYLSLYIEGDGAPWPSPAHPPRDPTPTIPTVLTMAVADPAGAVAYLGRPCQYLDAQALASCDPAYWDEARFAPEVVDEYSQVIDLLKARTGAGKLRLIGYSGGGVIAALLAARRTDVEQWTTVAAPLALEAWTNKQGISPLTRSLDPGRLPPGASPGRHWAGEQDPVVPVTVLKAFTERHGGILRIVPNFDHVCCWAERWPRLLEDSPE